jgi:hypothetical protein
MTTKLWPELENFLNENFNMEYCRSFPNPPYVWSIWEKSNKNVLVFETILPLNLKMHFHKLVEGIIKQNGFSRPLQMVLPSAEEIVNEYKRLASHRNIDENKERTMDRLNKQNIVFPYQSSIYYQLYKKNNLL